MPLTLNTALVAAAIFFLPGNALVVLLKPRISLDPVERFSLALGLSLAAIPISLYVMSILGLQQTTTSLWILLLTCGLITLWDIWRTRKGDDSASERVQRTTIIAFALIFLGALVARILGVSGIDFPLWTDSYHHTLFTQIIVDTGRVPTSYEPYAPIFNFTYHFGFHALTAWFHLLTGVPVPRSVVLVGQIVNALVVPTTYLLAKRLWGKTSIALFAAMVVGLLSHMPAQFVNWGRYTQLTGQILMPVVLALYLIVLELKKRSWSLILLTALSAAALFLTHNRITLFLIAFGALFLIRSMWEERKSPNHWKSYLIDTMLVAVIAIVVDLPWLINFAEGFGKQLAGTLVNGFDAAIHGAYFSWDWRYLPEFGARVWILLLSGLGIIIGGMRRNLNTLILALGTLILLALSFTNTINITPLFSALIVIIWIYLPLGLLSGYCLESIISWVSTKWATTSISNRYLLTLLTLITLLASIMGMFSVRDITLRENGFVREEDMLAMSWIRENTVPDALFYISTHFWTPIVAHGLDAGYWIPYLANRQTILPPQNYPVDGDKDFMALVNERARALSNANTMENLYSSLIIFDVTHVYIGERPAYLQGELFKEFPSLFDLQYHQGNVWIFAVRNPSEMDYQ
ncbi:MAG: glycosyltransferase family 39 protein [Anaerolineales bacterium]